MFWSENINLLRPYGYIGTGNIVSCEIWFVIGVTNCKCLYLESCNKPGNIISTHSDLRYLNLLEQISPKTKHERFTLIGLVSMFDELNVFFFSIFSAIHTKPIRLVSRSKTLKMSQCHAQGRQISSIDVKLIRVMRQAIVDDLMPSWHHYTYDVV